MRNKKIFKEMYDEKFDKEENYEKIIASLSDPSKKRRWVVMWPLVPVALLLIVTGAVFWKLKCSVLAPREYEYCLDKCTININQVEMNSPMKVSSGSGSVKDELDLAHYDLLELEIPDDLTDFEDVNVLYTPLEEAQVEDNGQEVYELVYKSDNRSIIVTFSESEIPVREYYSKENKTSMIDGIEMTLYNFKNDYVAIFSKDGINYEIETTDITKKEFLKLLKSMV